MNAHIEVPEWCRTDVEDAITHAVTRRVLELTDRVEATKVDAIERAPVAYLRLLLAAEQGDIARDVIAALQGVGVPFSGATGAGAEHERDEARGAMSDVDDAVRRLDVLRRSLEPTADAHAINTVLRALAHRTAAGNALAAVADEAQASQPWTDSLKRLHRAERTWTRDAMGRES